MIKSCILISLLGCVFAQMPMSMPMSMEPTAVSTEPCISNPQNASCINFNLPNPQNNINSLCGQMSNMPGCSIQSICQKNQNLQSSDHCSAISILKTICADMPKMSGCADFTSMCAEGSVVKQCQTPIFAAPTTMGMQDALNSICDSHHMDGCDTCPENYDCDLLMVYSEMCYMMPKMTECAAWATMCADSTAKTWPMCDLSKKSNAALTNQMSVAALAVTATCLIAL